MDNLFNLIGGWNLVLSVIIVTVFISAITVMFDGYFSIRVKQIRNRRKKVFTALVALFVAVANNTFVTGDTTLKSYALTIILTWSVAVLFYLLIGKWTLHRMIFWFKKLVSAKIGKV